MSMTCHVRIIFDEKFTQENITKIIQNGAGIGFKYEKQGQVSINDCWQPKLLAIELFQDTLTNDWDKVRSVVVDFEEFDFHLFFETINAQEFQMNVSSFSKIKETIFRFEEWEHQDFHWYTQLALALAEGLAIKKLWTEHI